MSRDHAELDSLDVELLTLLTRSPRISVLEASRQLRAARGTIQARLDKLRKRNVIEDLGPAISPRALGYPVMAYITVEIRQRQKHTDLVDQLAALPEVLEAHTITGAGDLLVRVAAESNAGLQLVIDKVNELSGVQRTSTVIALRELIPYRVLPLAQNAARN